MVIDLNYAALPPPRESACRRLLVRSPLAAGVCVLTALNYGHVYYHNIGSRCGWAVSNAEVLIWLAVAPIGAVHLFGLIANLHLPRHATPSRPICLALAADALSLLTPWLWEWRPDW